MTLPQLFRVVNYAFIAKRMGKYAHLLGETVNLSTLQKALQNHQIARYLRENILEPVIDEVLDTLIYENEPGDVKLNEFAEDLVEDPLQEEPATVKPKKGRKAKNG